MREPSSSSILSTRLWWSSRIARAQACAAVAAWCCRGAKHQPPFPQLLGLMPPGSRTPLLSALSFGLFLWEC